MQSVFFSQRKQESFVSKVIRLSHSCFGVIIGQILNMLRHHFITFSNTFIRSSLAEVFCKKVFLKNFQNLQENSCAQVRDATLFKKRFWHRCFPANVAAAYILSSVNDKQMKLDTFFIRIQLIRIFKLRLDKKLRTS